MRAAPGRCLVRQRRLHEHQASPCRHEVCQLAGNRLRQDRLGFTVDSEAQRPPAAASEVHALAVNGRTIPWQALVRKIPYPLGEFRWREESAAEGLNRLAHRTTRTYSAKGAWDCGTRPCQRIGGQEDSMNVRHFLCAVETSAGG